MQFEGRERLTTRRVRTGGEADGRMTVQAMHRLREMAREHGQVRVAIVGGIEKLFGTSRGLGALSEHSEEVNTAEREVWRTCG